MSAVEKREPLDLKTATRFFRHQNLLGAVPPQGWQVGFQRLLSGRCPYCDKAIHSIQYYGPLNNRLLTWSCINACNP